MSKTFVMSWLADGKIRLSKNAPAAVRALAETGLLNQEPIALRVHKPRDALAKKFKKAPDGLNDNNIYGVTAGQIWESLDPRHSALYPRQVRVLEVGATHALVIGMQLNTKSLINLKHFSGKGTRSYRRAMPALTNVQAAV